MNAPTSHARAHLPVCATCNDHGMIGGFCFPDGGYQSDPCPDCEARYVAALESRAIAMLTDEQAFATWERFRHAVKPQDQSEEATAAYIAAIYREIPA